MRTSGVTDVVVRLHPDDHLCRPFDDFAQFSARAAEFLVDGLEQGSARAASLRVTTWKQIWWRRPFSWRRCGTGGPR